MPQEQPTIWDILGWGDTYGDTRQAKWEESQLKGRGGTYADMPEDFMPGYQSGQENLGGYFSSLLETSGGFGDTLFGDEGAEALRTSMTMGEEDVYGELDIDKMLELLGGGDFRDMSEEDLKKSISDVYSEDFSKLREQGTYGDYHFSDLPTSSNIGNPDWSFSGGGDLTSEELYGEYSAWHEEQDFNNVNAKLLSFEDFEASLEGGFSPKYSRVGFEEGDLDELVKYAQSMQEGFKAAPTAESFGLGRKIGDIEKGGQRELKSSREGYIPGEILSRYGALQGKAGAKQKGEQLEQAYTSDIYGVQRGMGRDVRSTYEDFEDEWFSGIESWIGGLG
jgi:hypothetical protein